MTLIRQCNSLLRLGKSRGSGNVQGVYFPKVTDQLAGQGLGVLMRVSLRPPRTPDLPLEPVDWGRDWNLGLQGEMRFFLGVCFPAASLNRGGTCPQRLPCCRVAEALPAPLIRSSSIQSGCSSHREMVPSSAGGEGGDTAGWAPSREDLLGHGLGQHRARQRMSPPPHGPAYSVTSISHHDLEP